MKCTNNIVYALLATMLITIASCKKNEIDPLEQNFPQTLTEAKIYSGPISDLEPMADYVLYELSSALFTDYAEKQRLIKLPGTADNLCIKRNSITLPELNLIARNNVNRGYQCGDHLRALRSVHFY